MPSSLEATLLIANPVAQNGNGAVAAQHAQLALSRVLNGRLDVVLTQAAGHAVELAQAAENYSTVVALGGDGIIHEVANGLMCIPPDRRPALGVLPVGSGNDYARTLGMSVDIDAAVAQLLGADERAVDIGCCNGCFFVETLSFGVDAAIALDTVERRKRTGRTGTLLYLAAGLDQLLHHLDRYRYTACVDDASSTEGDMYLFAVQLGPTYGGGFRVCPKARIDDGLFDVCIAHPPLTVLYATTVFLRAKNGHHTHVKQLEFLRASSLDITFDAAPPAQIDGERIRADRYQISLVPRALRVLMPQNRTHA